MGDCGEPLKEDYSMSDDKTLEQTENTENTKGKKDPKQDPAYWEKRVKLKIASDANDPMGLNDVVVGVNGEVIRIKRDHTVMVKRKFVAALEDAVKITYVTDANGQVTGERKTPRYNMTVME